MQKQKNSTKVQNKFDGYYMEDMECKLCANFVDKLCSRPKCDYIDEKRDAYANGRIKRNKRIPRWDK